MAKGVIEKIKCDKCGYENEPQRIFCHECGAKLDRSEYVTEVEQARVREAREAPHRLQDLKKRMPIITGKSLLIYVLGPFMVALLVQMLMPMNPPPGPTTDDDQMAAMDLGPVYGSAFLEGNPKRVATTEEVISMHLQTRFKQRDRGTYWETALTSGWMFFEPDQFTIVTQRDALKVKMPIYFSATYGVVDRPEGDLLVMRSFFIGRLKLPGSLGQMMAPSLFGDLGDRVSLEAKDLAKIQNLEITEGAAVLTLK